MNGGKLLGMEGPELGELGDVLRAIAGTTDDPVVALDAGGTVLFADDEVLSFIGRSRADLGHFSIDQVLADPDVSWAARAIGRMYAGAPVAVPGNFRLPRHGGGDLAFAVYPVAYDGPDGELAFFAVLRPAASGPRHARE